MILSIPVLKIYFRFNSLILLGLTYIITCGYAFAQEPLKIKKVNGEIVFDGSPFEEVWNQVEPLPVAMFMPNFGNEPTEKTEIRIFYNDQYVYLSGRLYTKDPTTIRNTTKKRDEFGGNSDSFGVVFDSFNDKENALCFITSPSGQRTDFTVFNDANTGGEDMPLNFSWNTFWDVQTQITEEGWFVELRIPISSLRFQESDGEAVMGFIAWRFIPNSNELVMFPIIDPKFGGWAFLKPSQAQEVTFKDMMPKKPVYITPYALAGWQESSTLNHAETEYLYQSEPVFKVGGDLKYGITSNLTLDVTVNTDFAQVEADDQQVNLTRFSLFFPEKRQFFQERSSVFDFNLGGPNNLFYSRRIGLYEGVVVPIYGGVRLVGRAGKWDIGFLNMQTAAAHGYSEVHDLQDSVLQVSENFGVLRARRQVINENSYVGAILTSRIGIDGNYNIGYGVDGIFRIFGDDYIDIKWAQTFETDATNNPFSLAPTRLRLEWERRTIKKLAYNFSYSRSGEDFNPGVGFEARDNYTRFGNSVQWGWLPGENSKLYSHNIYLMGSYISRIENGSLESANIGPGWQFQTKSFFQGNFQLIYNVEDVDEEFDFSDDAGIPVGKYHFWNTKLMFTTPMTKPVWLIFMINTGQFYDGTRISFDVNPTWNVSSSLNLGLEYQYNQLNFQDRGEKFNAQIGRLKILYMLSTKFTVSAFIQYNSDLDAIASNIKLRYNPREGNDLYIVYNEGRNTRLDREIPRLPNISDRTIMIKYTYTFRL